MRVLVLGSHGQLGSDVVANAPSEYEIIEHTREKWDITDNESEYIFECSPDLIINCAAFTRVDDCEEMPDTAMSVNCDAVELIASRAAEIGAILMHVSTDYVFGGSSGSGKPPKNSPLLEDDEAIPVNIYGVSKLAGEESIRRKMDSHYIVRVASLFGKSEKKGGVGNFVYSILGLGRRLDEVRVIDDITMSPTYTVHAAKMMWKIIAEDSPFGIYHCNNEGECTWYEFTKEIYRLAGIRTRLIPISQSDFGSKAKRPEYSAMGTIRNYSKFSWKDGIQSFIEEITNQEEYGAK